MHAERENGKLYKLTIKHIIQGVSKVEKVDIKWEQE